ncbi:MAG: hypothetical protein UT94_C0047G0008 [Candidatus Uhrbacteria bacterium GW2011_GWF2_40_263]|nr:MAG: hypothetical protein UT94_C0047G0008 [Candidatus Uhrbacteria bacterium GW2011_GWF2_40_263]
MTRDNTKKRPFCQSFVHHAEFHPQFPGFGNNKNPPVFAEGFLVELGGIVLTSHHCSGSGSEPGLAVWSAGHTSLRPFNSQASHAGGLLCVPSKNHHMRGDLLVELGGIEPPSGKV